MQPDIVTFLSATRRHFLSKDLVALASTLLATRDADFWVRLAASTLLFIQHGEFNHQSLLLEQNGPLEQNLALVEEYNSLPSWLEEYKGSESVLFSGLSPRVGEPRVPAEVANNNRVENVVLIGGGGDQEELSTSQTNSQSKIGERKHDEAEVREDQAPEDTGTKNLQVDADENSARVVLGDVVFARAKCLSCWLTFRDRHAIQRFKSVCCSQCCQTMAS